MKLLSSYLFYLLITLIILPFFLLISLLIIILTGLPVIHWSKRVGHNNKLFYMAKFRTMKNNTPQLATHKLLNPDKYITSIGYFLRKSSLDELPQFINLLKLEMRIVGPRPALFNQNDLIKKRKIRKIHNLIPGITGLAQISGRDNMSIDEKVELDYEYLKKKSFTFDMMIISRTLKNIIFSKNISH